MHSFLHYILGRSKERIDYIITFPILGYNSPFYFGPGCDEGIGAGGSDNILGYNIMIKGSDYYNAKI